MRTSSISIIVPVYNAEKFLDICISSIEKINSIDWELLLIDDGSTDSSADICDKFAKKNSRIKVFHIPNGGVSNARNLGIKKATKEHIAFIDSDDYINAKKFEEAFNCYIEYDSDLAITPYTQIKKGRKKFISLNYGESRNISFSEKFFFFQNRLAPSNDFLAVIWRVFFNRKLLLNLKFNSDMKFHEDALFIIQAFYMANKISIINIPFYFYRINESSASFNAEVNTIHARLDFLNKLQDFSKTNNIDLSFAQIKRKCPIYARLFAKASKDANKRNERFLALKKIHNDIPIKECIQWRMSFWGFSFKPYVILRKLGLHRIALYYLYFRFL